jgi:long-chain fatty acid transport protein
MRRTLQIAICAAICASATTGQANPLDFFGDGARAAAMGGANTAGALDGSANHYNPALLSRLPRMIIELGYHWAKPIARIDGRDLGVDAIRGMRVALGVPGQVGKAKLGFGIGVRLPDQHIIRIRALDQTQPRFVLLDNLAQRLYMSANLSLALGDSLSIGVGTGFFAETAGSVDLTGRLGFTVPEDSDLAIALDMKVKRVVYPQAGIAYQPVEWLRLGASYRGEISPALDQTVGIEGNVGPEGADPIVEGASVALRSFTLMHYQPEQYTIGVSGVITPQLTVSFDGAIHRWSRFGSPASELSSEIDLKDFNDLFDPPEEVTIVDPDFKDVMVLHFGGEYLLNPGAQTQYTARGGYRFDPSPAPEQTGVTNYVDNDKHTLSAGLGLGISDISILTAPLLLDFMIASTYMPTRSHHKTSAIDPVGDYRANGWIWQFALNSKVPF